MLPFLPLPIGGTSEGGPLSADDNASTVLGKRSAAERPPEWIFFAQPWGDSRKGPLQPVGVQEAFNSSDSLMNQAMHNFCDNEKSGCGNWIGNYLKSDLQEDAATTMLVTGLYDRPQNRVVALMTLALGSSTAGLQGNFNYILTRIKEQYVNGDWFDEQGQPTAFVDPEQQSLGGKLAYTEKLTFYVKNLCTAHSATDPEMQVKGAGRSILQQTFDYLKNYAAPQIELIYHDASRVKDLEERLVNDRTRSAWAAAMARRDLYVQLYSTQRALEFYKNQGFEIVPLRLQQENDPDHSASNNVLWKRLYS